MESGALRSLVGGQKKSIGIYRTAEAGNRGGSKSPVLTVEEREELESRGINPIGIGEIFYTNSKKKPRKTTFGWTIRTIITSNMKRMKMFIFLFPII